MLTVQKKAVDSALFVMAAPQVYKILDFLLSNPRSQRQKTMRVVDLRDVPIEQKLEADVCIVGSGPAGSTIVRELVGSGLTVIVVKNAGRSWALVVTVEHNYLLAKRNAVYQLLTSKGYCRVLEQLSAFDDWYVWPGIAELIKAPFRRGNRPIEKLEWRPNET